MSTMWVQPTGGALGADVYGVDLSQPMSDATFQKILDAWGEHLVLRFSGQKLDDPTLMKFSARFGTDALKFVNKSPGRELRLRGVNTRVVTAGAVRIGDSITKLA